MTNVTLPGRHSGHEVVGGIDFRDGKATDVKLGSSKLAYFKSIGATITEKKAAAAKPSNAKEPAEPEPEAEPDK